jgi:1-acyl-sn-glycerol-3-phosphate acyltransferase
MIITASHHKIISPFFRFYTIRKIEKSFEKVCMIGNYIDEKTPMLAFSNHYSWWDGFWVHYLDLKLFKRKFYFMMLEDQLKKHWFFKYTGGFSVNKGSRSVLESINYAARLLSKPQNMVLMFPQGKIQSLHTKEFKFEKGAEYILKRANENVQVMFIANLIDYFSNPKPSLYIYFEEFNEKTFSIESIQKAYNSFYEKCINKNLKLP